MRATSLGILFGKVEDCSVKRGRETSLESQTAVRGLGELDLGITTWRDFKDWEGQRKFM